MKDRKDSLKDLSSQTAALILYEQGDEHWRMLLKGGDYVVCTSGDFLVVKNFIYKVLFVEQYVGNRLVLDDGAGNQYSWLYKSNATTSNFRPAYAHEIDIYKRHGNSTEISAHQTKDNAYTGLSDSLNETIDTAAASIDWDSLGGLTNNKFKSIDEVPSEKEQLLEEAKRRYPKGTKVRSPLDSSYIGISTGHLFFSKFPLDIRAGHAEGGNFYVRHNGEWGEVVEETKKSEDKTGNEDYERFVRLHSPTFNNGSPYCKTKMKEAGNYIAGCDSYEKEQKSACGHGLLRDEDGQIVWLGKGWVGDLEGREQLTNPNSIHTVSSRPSVIPFKEDKHIDINILKRNINI